MKAGLRQCPSAVGGSSHQHTQPLTAPANNTKKGSEESARKT